ncbi:hypothetical protein H5410_005236 [Solanum commersonii]|uniref:Protein FAR1-RELATED SEQUENCE n=1 Tax=Solanum commersonii TaxID=4109 RepID=A0A9J6A6M9_SOLCO|nr:hypothetical protein H5410_005236 [Solanum commersonii]
MLEKYDLKDNNWLKNTFAIREKWSMAYGRNIFSAGMQSTQLRDFHKYNVSTHESGREHAVVVKQSTKVLSCSCKLFEFSGVLCGHALKILNTLNVKDKISDHYILKRWTQNAET